MSLPPYQCPWPGKPIYRPPDLFPTIPQVASDRLPQYRHLRRPLHTGDRVKLFGIGVATAVAATGGRDYEHAEIRFDPSGGVVLLTGSMDDG